MANSLLTTLKLVLVIAIVAGGAYVATLLLASINDAVKKGKKELSGRGISLNKNGVAVKTDRRAMTQEQTQDKLQSSIMRAWKATQFNVPGVLKGTRLAGSAHDKNKADYDAKNGSKISHKSKNPVE